MAQRAAPEHQRAAVLQGNAALCVVRSCPCPLCSRCRPNGLTSHAGGLVLAPDALNDDGAPGKHCQDHAEAEVLGALELERAVRDRDPHGRGRRAAPSTVEARSHAARSDAGEGLPRAGAPLRGAEALRCALPEGRSPRRSQALPGALSASRERVAQAQRPPGVRPTRADSGPPAAPAPPAPAPNRRFGLSRARLAPSRPAAAPATPGSAAVRSLPAR